MTAESDQLVQMRRGSLEARERGDFDRLALESRAIPRPKLTMANAPAPTDDRPPPLGDGYIDTLAANDEQQSRARAGARADPTITVSFRHLADIVAERREPVWLIHNTLEARVLAVFAGVRGSFKSFIALRWAMRVALDGRGVAILSGEGAGLDRRAAAFMQEFAPKQTLAELPIVALERPLSLNLEPELRAVVDAIRGLSFRVQLIVVDTLSKFSAGLDENSNFEVAMFLSRLAATLRDSLDCTVLLVAHVGHHDSKRPRGAYVLMANPDAEYIVDRPDSAGTSVTVSRDRFKDCPALPPLAYTARIVDLGRADRYDERVTSLVLDEADAPTPKARGPGKNPEKALTALREWCRANTGDVIASGDLVALFKAQAIGRQRKPEVLNYLCNAGILTASVGGHSINRSAL